jgi:ferrous iron transport protein B
LWEKAKDFLQRAFTVIFIATIVVWFLQSFNWKMQLVDDAELSILASIARLISPLMKPIGLGDWQISVALVSGFIAKESVVSTLEILFAGGVQTVISSVSAASLLVFSLLYTPCVAAIASVKRELGSKWAAGLVFWQCALAWLCALAVCLISLIIG